MDSHASQSNLVIITHKNKIIRFIKVYSRTLTLLLTPLVLIPIATMGDDNAYISLYIFLVTAVYWIANVLHPGVTSLIVLAFITIMGCFDIKLIDTINIADSVLDCLGVMMVIIAIEQSYVHRRAAIKILLLFGCSHFRLVFISAVKFYYSLWTFTVELGVRLFYRNVRPNWLVCPAIGFGDLATLSMCLSNTVACGLMIPLVKAILMELEKMGILDMREITVELNQNDELVQRPTDFTVFYFLGIAYSSTIGGMANMVGSETNQILRNYCALIFPQSPRLEVPHYLLLTLPGVLVMEMCLYLWLNFYFLGMMRVQNYTALQSSLTAEEEQYISILLNTQYDQMGKMKFQEMIVIGIVVLTAVLQTVINATSLTNITNTRLVRTSGPTIISVIVLFIIPVNFDCLKFFVRNIEPLPTSRSCGILTWAIVRKNLHWSVLFVIASSNITFETLKYTKMTEEFEKFLLLFGNLPLPVTALAVAILCKILTEFASNTTVARCFLRNIATLSVATKINPLYLMISATLSCSLPFHLITGTPANALVLAHMNIPHHKMLIAGIGPSIIGILTNLFTGCVWSKAIWPNITTYPEWAEDMNESILKF